MADVFDKDGKPVTIPDEEVQPRYLNGEIGFDRGTLVPISDASGSNFGHVPAEHLHDAFAKGWKFDPAGVENAKYGGLGQQAIAGAEGLASGATLGGSELLEKGLGVAPQGIAGRAHANPITSGMSKMGGAGVGALAATALGAPEAAPAELAEGIEAGGGILDAVRGIAGASPAGMLAKAGGAVEDAFGGGMIGNVARGATEAGAFSAADEATRQVIEGDDASIPVRAQKVLASAGLGALFGGGVSGLFHVAGALSSGAMGKALDAFAPEGAPKGVTPDSLESAVDAVTEKAEKDPTSFVGKVIDALVGGKDRRAAMGRLLDGDYRAAARTAESDANSRIIGAGDSIQTLVESVSQAAKNIGTTVKPEEVTAGLGKVDPVTVRQRAFDLATGMWQRAEEMRRNPADFFDSSKIEQIELQARKLDTELGVKPVMRPILDSAGYPMLDEHGAAILGPQRELANAGIPKTQDVWDTLNQVKRNLEKVSKIGEMVPETEKPAAKAAGDFRQAIRGLLQDDTVFGSAASAQAKYDGILHDFYAKADEFLQTKNFGERAAVRGGDQTYSVNRKSINEFFKNFGDANNETRRKAFVDFMTSSRQVADIFESDPALQQQLASAYGKTADAAKLSRAMADLKMVKGKATAVEQLFGTPLGRVFLGSQLVGPLGGLAFAGGGGAGISAIAHLLDSVVAKNGAELSTMARAIASGTRPVANRAPVAALKILQMATFSDRTPKATRDKREAFKRVAGEVLGLASDPARAQALMQSKVAPIAKEAPKHAAAMVAQGTRSIFYLASILPPMPAVSPLSPGPSKSAPSDSAIADFAEAVKVVSNPMTAIEDLAHNRLSMVGARTLRATNPELFQEMQTEVLKAIDEKAKTLPYRTRQQVGLFFGAPLDPALDPKMIAGLQASFASPPNPNENKPLRSTRELRSIKNAASAMQRLEGS